MTATGAFENIIKQMLSANNDARHAAEGAFEEAKKNPDALVGSLMQVLRNSAEPESRAFSAVMLRKVISIEASASSSLQL